MGQKGASAVEFALVLPLLILFLFGIIEFGFIMYDKEVITNASREGARAGIVFVPGGAVSEATIDQTVQNYSSSHLVSLGSSVAPLTTTVTGNCAVPGSTLKVTVQYPYTFLVLPNFVNSLSGSLTLTADTLMNCENI